MSISFCKYQLFSFYCSTFNLRRPMIRYFYCSTFNLTRLVIRLWVVMFHWKRPFLNCFFFSKSNTCLAFPLCFLLQKAALLFHFVFIFHCPIICRYTFVCLGPGLKMLCFEEELVQSLINVC